LDFRTQAEALGAGLARVHVGMAAAFGTEPATGTKLADAMVARARRTLEEPDESARVERSYRRLDAVTDVGVSMRIHGALDLGRVVSGRHGWSFVDFTADPVQPADERRERSSPLRDVASMLQSIHRTATDALVEVETDPESTLLVAAWEERAAKAFVSGYTSVDAVHQLLPSDRPARDALLAVFELNANIDRLGRRTLTSPGDPADSVVIQLRADHHPHRW
jgi:predicted trehalose synthase